MKIVSTIFPINLYLSIFQLEGYDILRFLKWISLNFFTRNISRKKKLVYTFKTKLLLILSFVLFVFIFSFSLLVFKSYFNSFLLTIIILTQFYLPLIISRLVLYPLEFMLIQIIISKTKNKIKSIKNLKVIGITGSYGKTSVKELLYQLVIGKYKTLKTPESYNTILGIFKIVDYELDDSYELFICEMAAYHKNDIKRLCKIVPPQYGILTGITTQHLERFENLENIVDTKFELYDFISNKNNIILNLNDVNISKEINKRNVSNSCSYLYYSNIIFSKNGTNFDLLYEGKKYKINTNLFGFSTIENLIGAITMALKIGIKMEDILNKIQKLVPVANRFMLRNYNKSTIVDNTFSSNEESFNEMVKTAKNVKGTKILVTPGLVELGNKEITINSEVGKLINNVFDKIILVGTNNRTKAFAKYLKNKPEYIPDDRKDYFEKIEELSKKYDWIFLENDITENY